MGFAEFFNHLLLLFATGLGLVGVPLPLPLPPLPEDPALLRAAPVESALFVQWFGSGKPNAATDNRAERLAAEPEVRGAIARLVAATRGTIGGSEDELPAVLALFDLAVDSLQRPGCLFVLECTPFAGGLVVRRDDAGEVATTFGASLGTLIGGSEGLEYPIRELAGAEFRVLEAPDDTVLLWGAIDDYFALALGEQSAAQIVRGLRGENAGLGGLAAVQRLRSDCKVQRPVLRTFAAFDKLGAQASFAARLWRPLGIDQVAAALAESGLEGDGFVSRVQLETAEPKGLLGQLRGRRLSVDDLGLIPDDATIALALRTAEGAIEGAALQIAGALSGEQTEREWEQMLAMVHQRSTVHFRDDLIAHIDDCVVAWSSPRQGGLGFSSAVAAVPLRNAVAFDEQLAKMWEKMTEFAPNKDKAREQNDRLSHRAYLEQFEHKGRKVWWVDLIDREMPFAFAWSNTDAHFLFGLQPQPVRSAIERSDAPNFDRALVRKPLVARRGDATALFYLDLKGLLHQGYGALTMLLQLNSLEWQRDGFDFDLADVPRLTSLTPHLGAELTVLEHVDGGCRITRRGSVPVLDLLLVTGGMACLMQMD